MLKVDLNVLHSAFSVRNSAFTLIHTRPFLSVTSYVLIPTVAGPLRTLPVVTSNWDPCHGHCTVSHASTPSDSGPPLCVHRSSNATYPFSVRPRTIRRSPRRSSFI